MIRNLLATTAIATLVATGAAMAQTTAPAPTAPMDAAPEQPRVKKAEGYLASNIIGETVYNGTGEDAQNIGKVSDIVLDAEGNIQAVVIGVGGFLGIGQKAVAIEYDLVSWTEMDGEEYIVVETSREALEAQAEFDAAAFEPQPADAEVGNTKPATAEDLANAPVEEEAAPADDMSAAPADDAAPAGDMAAAPTDDAAPADDMAAAPAEDPAATEETDDMAAAPADDSAATEETDDMAAAPADEAAPAEEDTAAAPADDAATETDQTETAAIDRSTLNEVTTGDVAAEDFVGTTVYGADDANIGEIGDVILSQDGAVEAVIIDVGGFLGVGEKQVAVGMENLAFLSDEDNNMYLYTDFTQEQLEAQADYDESTFAESRDEQLLNIE